MSHFRTTRWSLILETRQHGPKAREALAELCRIYRPAVVAFARKHGYSTVDAEDLAQSFYADLLSRDFHAHADPSRGRFRAYLLTALRHFMANSRAHDEAQKRGGRALRVPLLDDDVEAPLDDESPEQAFDRAWALELLRQALLRLEQETRLAGKNELFQHLRGFLVDDPDSDDYARLAQQLGMRTNTIAVAVHRMRRRLRIQVAMALKETVGDTEAADAEFAHLKVALGRPPTHALRCHQAVE